MKNIDWMRRFWYVEYEWACEDGILRYGWQDGGCAPAVQRVSVKQLRWLLVSAAPMWLWPKTQDECTAAERRLLLRAVMVRVFITDVRNIDEIDALIAGAAETLVAWIF